MRPVGEIYDDAQENLRDADNRWFSWSLTLLCVAVVYLGGLYFIQMTFGFVGLGINTVIYLLVYWLFITTLTTPTALTTVVLIGLLRLKLSSTVQSYLANVMPAILFWMSGVTLTMAVIPFFWWSPLTFLWAVAASLGFATWTWHYKSDTKVMKSLSWKFLCFIIFWAFVGLPTISWVSSWSWFNSSQQEVYTAPTSQSEQMLQLADWFCDDQSTASYERQPILGLNFGRGLQAVARTAGLIAPQEMVQVTAPDYVAQIGLCMDMAKDGIIYRDIYVPPLASGQLVAAEIHPVWQQEFGVNPNIKIVFGDPPNWNSTQGWPNGVLGYLTQKRNGSSIRPHWYVVAVPVERMHAYNLNALLVRVRTGTT